MRTLFARGLDNKMANGINQNACSVSLELSCVRQGVSSRFMAQKSTAPASQLRADIAQYTQRYSIHDPPSSSEGTSSHAGTTGAATACGGQGAGGALFGRYGDLVELVEVGLVGEDAADVCNELAHLAVGVALDDNGERLAASTPHRALDG